MEPTLRQKAELRIMAKQKKIKLNFKVKTERKNEIKNIANTHRHLNTQLVNIHHHVTGYTQQKLYETENPKDVREAETCSYPLYIEL